MLSGNQPDKSIDDGNHKAGTYTNGAQLEEGNKLDVPGRRQGGLAGSKRLSGWRLSSLGPCPHPCIHPSPIVQYCFLWEDARCYKPRLAEWVSRSPVPFTPTRHRVASSLQRRRKRMLGGLEWNARACRWAATIPSGRQEEVKVTDYRCQPHVSWRAQQSGGAS